MSASMHLPLVVSLLYYASAVNYCGNETHLITSYVVSTDPTQCGWTDKEGLGAASLFPEEIDNAGAYDNKSSFTQHASVVPSVQDLSGRTYSVGMTDVIFTATDANGNINSCAGIIDVRDLTPPSWNEPGGSTEKLHCNTVQTIKTDTKKCTAYYSFAEPTATDNCGKVTNVVKPSVPATGHHYSLGTTILRHVVQDSSKNEATCEFKVEVVDAEPPTLVCDSDISATLSSAVTNCSSDAIVTYSCTASDNCKPSLPHKCSVVSGTKLNVGKHDIVCEAVDAAGLKTEVKMVASVFDRTAPKFKSCPSSFSYKLTADAAGPTWSVPEAQDNSCEFPVVKEANSYIPGQALSAGKHQITYSATDSSGNQAFCTFAITVEDTRAPTLTSCPTKDIQISPQSHHARAKAIFIQPSAMDFDNTTLVASGPSSLIKSGMWFPLGVSHLQYIFTGKSGVTTQCQFNVIVNDTQAPSVVSDFAKIFVCSSKDATGALPYAQCGGVVIPILSLNGLVNTLGPVKTFAGPSSCCNAEYSCQGDELYKACLPRPISEESDR